MSRSVSGRSRAEPAVAYDEALAARIRAALAGAPEVQEKRMFGGLAFLVEGSMVAAANGHGGLMVRCDPDRTEELLREPGTSRPAMGTRTIHRGWVVIESDRLQEDADLRRWLDQAIAD